jgi:(1->4)-alpha-D-glucan 1-alpha-D-glucosylmutase
MTGTTRRVPSATYRLQLGGGFGFAEAAAAVCYLHALGVSHLSLSPPFRARSGSSHGYDVVDHRSLDPALGGDETFRELSARLAEREMGGLLDVVPNHMCVATAENAWWSDVLENGPSSPHARCFDVDGRPPKPDLVDKVLLPILGDQYGRVLENGELRVEYAQGAFRLRYYDHHLPVAPRTLPLILEAALQQVRADLGPDHASVLELESIFTALAHLPRRDETQPGRVRERQRENAIVKKRLASLTDFEPAVRAAVEGSLTELNGVGGDPRRFDRLEALLADQAYRLSHWRVASDEINYRRFFDVNELAAVHVEEPEVFAAVRELAFRLHAEGAVHGLRIDHVDGLYDPADYLARLPAGAYVVVEKILAGHERLCADWSVQGTTGYDFLNLVNGLLVEPEGRRALDRVYARFTGSPESWADVDYESRKLVLDTSMSSELTVLARRLDRVSEPHRFSRDFTLNSLQAALGEVIACFPVYRSYLRAHAAPIDAPDRGHVEKAVRAAKRRNPATSECVFGFIAAVLLRDDPGGLEESQVRERREFVMRFQQLTGPVIAKGMEDTAFYRFHPLASLNEVGGDPSGPGTTLNAFHAANLERLRSWPHTLCATSTHDTERGEDTRARIAVLSEVPAAFEAALGRWRALGAAHKTQVDEAETPDPHAEYLLYQTLVGTWVPAGDGAPPPAYLARIHAYMRKVLREAKLRTSWISPTARYEEAVEDFVSTLLDARRGGPFLEDLGRFVGEVPRPGLLDSVTQALLKATAPRVPDFYQGSERWPFDLVDPDNRHPVDVTLRSRLLESLEAVPAGTVAGAASLLERIEDGRLKLLVTSRALRFRRQRRELFARGAYHPLRARSPREELVAAFARQAEGQA